MSSTVFTRCVSAHALEGARIVNDVAPHAAAMDALTTAFAIGFGRAAQSAALRGGSAGSAGGGARASHPRVVTRDLLEHVLCGEAEHLVRLGERDKQRRKVRYTNYSGWARSCARQECPCEEWIEVPAPEASGWHPLPRFALVYTDGFARVDRAHWLRARPGAGPSDADGSRDRAGRVLLHRLVFSRTGTSSNAGIAGRCHDQCDREVGRDPVELAAR